MEKRHSADSPHNTPVGKGGTQTPWPYITVSIVGVVVLLAAAATIWLQFFAPAPTTYDTGRNRSGDYFDRRDYSDRHFNAATGTEIEFYGVISKQTSDMLTVIGGGKQVTVRVVDDTHIRSDGQKLAINDTIAVVGTEDSDGTVTATHVMVVNDEVFDRYDRDDPPPKQRSPSA